MAEVVQNQSDSFITMSAKVAEVHEALNTLKNLILQLRADNPYAKSKTQERKAERGMCYLLAPLLSSPLSFSFFGRRCGYYYSH